MVGSLVATHTSRSSRRVSRDAQRQIQRALEVSADIDDQLQSVEATFDLPGIEDLRQVAKNLGAALAAAQSTASTLVALVSGAIVLQGGADR